MREVVDFKFLDLSKITSFACQLLIFQEETANASEVAQSCPTRQPHGL